MKLKIEVFLVSSQLYQQTNYFFPGTREEQAVSSLLKLVPVRLEYQHLQSFQLDWLPLQPYTYLLFEYFKRILIFLGTREERAVSSLLKMGPAIVNGGITTFLALLLLGFSQSHVFITFFKVLIELVIQFFQSLEKKSVFAIVKRSVYVLQLLH